jgi:prepilin-type processing-associated H-X9-DG protein
MQRAMILLIPAVVLFLSPMVRAAAPLADQFPADSILYLGFNGGSELQKQYGPSNLKGVVESLQIPQLITAAIAKAQQTQSPLEQQQTQQTVQLLELLANHNTALDVSLLPTSDPSHPNTVILLAVQGGDDTASITALMNQMIAPAMGMASVYQHGDATVLQAFIPSPADQNNLAGLISMQYVAASASESLATTPDFVSAMQSLQSNAVIAAYVQAPQILALLRAGVAAQPDSQVAQYDQLIKSLGVDTIKSFACSGGFNSADWESEYFMDIPASSLLMQRLLFNAKPLIQQDYQLVPAAVGTASIETINLNGLLDEVKQIVGIFDPQSAAQLQLGIFMADGILGLDIQKDLLDPLSGTWASYQASDANGALADIVMVHPLFNEVAFSTSLTSLFARINSLIEARGIPLGVLNLHSRDVFYYVSGLPMGLTSPTLAVHDGKLIYGLSTQAVLAAANRNSGDESINENSDLQRIRQRLRIPQGSEIAMQYVQTNLIAQQVIAYTQQILLPTLQDKQIIPSDIPIVSPDAASAYFTSYAGFSWVDSTGWHGASLGPFPGVPLLTSVSYLTNSHGAALPLMIAILLPSLAKARELANRTTSSANERSILEICMIDAQSNNQQCPPSFGELIADGDITPKMLIDPSSNSTPLVVPLEHAQDAAWINANLTGHCDYIYVGAGVNLANLENNGSHFVLLYEPLSVHQNDGAVVGFADGHVEWEAGPGIEQIILDQNNQRQSLGLPPLPTDPNAKQ